MRMHPQARAALEAQSGEVAPGAPGYDLVAEREQMRAEVESMPREPVHDVRDLDADGVPVRLYRPAGEVTGLVLHAHGGGFVLGDVEVHDPAVRRLVNRSGLAVLSVDYRRPPEHPFPAAPDDLSTVVRWLDEGALGRLGLRDGVPLLGHGDSAGANLALVAALRHPGRFAALALVYPFLDPTGAGASYDEVAGGFAGSGAQWYWEQYAASPDDLADPDLAPLLSDRLETLPPTLVVTAEHDAVRDEGELLAERLAELGVSVVATRYLGAVHGFWRRPEVFDAAEPLMRQVAGFLRQHV